MTTPSTVAELLPSLSPQERAFILKLSHPTAEVASREAQPGFVMLRSGGYSDSLIGACVFIGGHPADQMWEPNGPTEQLTFQPGYRLITVARDPRRQVFITVCAGTPNPQPNPDSWEYDPLPAEQAVSPEQAELVESLRVSLEVQAEIAGLLEQVTSGGKGVELAERLYKLMVPINQRHPRWNQFYLAGWNLWRLFTDSPRYRVIGQDERVSAVRYARECLLSSIKHQERRLSQ